MWKRKTELPYLISETVKRLKAENGFYITVRRINGAYYLYKEWPVWDKYRKKQKVMSEYFGSVYEDGTFKKKASSHKLNLQNAIKLIEDSGGKVLLAEKNEQSVGAFPEPEGNDKKLITCLTMNSRLTAHKIGEIVGMKESDVYYRLETLEKRFGFEYLAQIFAPPIGYYPYLILIKFTDEKPTLEELKAAIGGEPRVQFSVMAKGEYDVIGYILEESPFMASRTVLKLRTNTVLSKYPSVFYTTPISQRYGYIHIRDEFFDQVLSRKITNKKNVNAGNLPTLSEREFIVLRELNANGIINFTEIDKKHDLPKGTALYTYGKLRMKEVIVRSTISAENTGIRYFGMIFIQRLDMSKYLRTKDYLSFDLINDDEMLSKYALICDVGAPDMIILILPIRGATSIDQIAGHFREKMEGVNISTAIVTESIVGHLCIRRFDSNYTYYYDELVSERKLDRRTKTDYESVIHKGI